MNQWLMVIGFALCCLHPAMALPLRFGSEIVDGYLESSESGLWPELLAEVYGQDISVEILPFKRGSSLVSTGELDGWLSVYSDFIPNTIIPRQPVGLDNISATLTDKKNGEWQGKGSLTNFLCGWLRGYDYDQVLGLRLQFQEVDDRAQLVAMLERGRINAVIDNRHLLAPYLSQSIAAGHDTYYTTTIEDKPLYIAFPNTSHGLALAQQWDRQITILLKSGKLHRLFQKQRLKQKLSEQYPFPWK